MQIFRIASFIVMVFASLTLNGQGISDAIRYSSYNQLGTARFMGAGGAFGALGGDLSVMSVNPAGIADFYKSEFLLTPSLLNVSTEASFLADGFQNTRSKTGFGINNIGFVAASRPRGSLVTSNFAIAFNRKADFNRQYSIKGETEGSISQFFQSFADGNTPDELSNFDTGIAYEAGVIYDFDGDNLYEIDYSGSPVQTDKEQVVDESGSVSELSFAWAGNIENKLNIGVGLGIPFVSFSQSKIYSEDAVEETYSSQLQYVEQLSTSGAGVNFNLGLQYKATKNFRVGAAVHSPDYLVLTDDFNNSVTYRFTSEFENLDNTSASPDGSFKYRFTTPWRAVGSLAAILNMGEVKGFLSTDIEFLDYGSNSFDFTSHSNEPIEALNTTLANEEISTQLGSATNLRFGGELAYKKYRLRAGYNVIGSPFEVDGVNRNIASFGGGVRDNGFYIDVAYVLSSLEQGYLPYQPRQDLGNDPFANLDTNAGRFTMTVGFMF